MKKANVPLKYCKKILQKKIFPAICCVVFLSWRHGQDWSCGKWLQNKMPKMWSKSWNSGQHSLCSLIPRTPGNEATVYVHVCCWLQLTFRPKGVYVCVSLTFVTRAFEKRQVNLQDVAVIFFASFFLSISQLTNLSIYLCIYLSTYEVIFTTFLPQYVWHIQWWVWNAGLPEVPAWLRDESEIPGRFVKHYQ